MPKTIKKRSEKRISTEEDIRDTVVDIRERLKERQRILIYGAVIFIAVVISVIAFTVYTKTSTNKALGLELEGYKLFYGDYDDRILTTPAERYQKALKVFKDSYAAKKQPHILLYIANCHYELGSYDEAIKALRELNSQFSDPTIISLSYYKMAMAYVKKGDMDNALASLKNLLSIKDSALQDMALLESGKILELMGRKDDAKIKYNEIINKFPKSPLLNEARARMEKI